MNKTLLSIGHGYSAQALAKIALQHGWTVIGTTRNEDGLEKIAETTTKAVQWPGADLRPHIKAASHILTSVAPNETGDPVFQAYAKDIAQTSLDWFGYLSTTGVYGDHGGDWVDETTPLTPSTRRGQWRVAAESNWQSLEGLPLHIFRLAGIYGPGRGPFSKVLNGTARRIVKQGQVFSRIHVDDIARVLWASIGRPRAGAIYNVCDNDPAPPQDVIGYAARLLGVEQPPEVDFETAEMSPMARSFYAESKRVRNTLIKEELGVTLIYPDYKTGLEALLQQERNLTNP